MVSVIALSLHKHSHVSRLLVLRRDRCVAVLAHGAGFFLIKCDFFFLVIVSRLNHGWLFDLDRFNLRFLLHHFGLCLLREYVRLHQGLGLHLLLRLLHHRSWLHLTLLKLGLHHLRLHHVLCWSWGNWIWDPSFDVGRKRSEERKQVLKRLMRPSLVRLCLRVCVFL